MKRHLLLLSAAAVALGSQAADKAFYVHRTTGEYSKYNFGVAEALKFSNEGRTLRVAGYDEEINMDNVDFISLSPIISAEVVPGAQKEKMVKAGDELYSKFSLYKIADLLNMWHCFFDYRYENGHSIYPPSGYDVPDEYYDVHNAFKGIMRSAKGLTEGDFSAICKMMAKSVDLYKIEDYFGVYVADAKDEVWVRTSRPDSYLELRYDSRSSTPYFVRLTPSNGYTTWETSDFNLQMPRTMTLTFGQGDKVFATAEILSEIVQDKSISMDITFTAGEYVVKNTMKVTDNLLSDDTTVVLGGETVVTANASLPGKNLMNYDMMYDAFRESSHYHDEIGNCQGEDPSLLISHFTKGNATVDVLGQIQVKGIVASPSKFYDRVSQDVDKYDPIEMGSPNRLLYTEGKILEKRGSEYVVSRQEETIIADIVKALNDYTDARYYYDGKNDLQGYFTYDYTDESYSWNIDPDDYTDRHAYTEVDGCLVNVYRDKIYDNDGEMIGYTDWYYGIDLVEWYGLDYDYIGSESVVVPASAVFIPGKITYIDYYITPLLTFPDQTTYDVSDFFDEKSFKTLINDYDDIIDTYLSITGQD